MRRWILFLAFAFLPASPALAQAPLASTGGDNLDRNIADYEDTLRKIRDGWIYLPVPGAGALVSREQEAGLFSHMILLGTLSPDSVVSMHRKLKEGTRYLQTQVEGILEGLYADRTRRNLGPPPPSAPLFDEAQGVVRGNWSVSCWTDGIATGEGGTFSLRLLGDGNVSGSYSGPSGTLAVGGQIDVAGNITGGGTHPDGPFSYIARLAMVGTTPQLIGGTVRIVPRNANTSCAGGSLTPSG